MRFFVIVVLFLLAVAGSSFLAKVGWRDSVEAELARRARAALESEGYGDVVVAFDHHDGRLSGTVDRSEEVAEVLRLLGESVPEARWPEVGSVELGIRPTLPPRLRVARAEGSDEARIEGALSLDGDAGRALLGSRLRAVPGIGRVDNAVELDPMVLSFPKMAEFASLAGSLLGHPGASEIALAEGRLSIVGQVPNEGLKSGLLDLAAAIGTEELSDRIEIVAPASFERFAEAKVTRNRFGVTLFATLPDEAAVAAMKEALSSGGVEPAPASRIEAADDCGPARWQEHFRPLLAGLLAELSGEFTADFSAERVRISGAASDAEARQRLLDRLEPLRTGDGAPGIAADISLRSEDLAAAVSLTSVYKDGLLSLTGTLPERSVASLIEAKVKEALPELLVKIEIEGGNEGGDPDWTGGLPEFFAEALPRVSSASFVFRKGELELEGRTLSLSDRQLIQNLAVNTLPTSYRILNRLLHADQPFPKPPLLPEDRTRLAETLKALPVYFDKGAGTLGEEGRAKVASIADEVKSAGDGIGLLLTGFADNIGNRESNERLARSRAESVRAELVRLGHEESKLSLDGVVEDVSRLPRSERGKSRRVEISLAPAAP